MNKKIQTAVDEASWGRTVAATSVAAGGKFTYVGMQELVSHYTDRTTALVSRFLTIIAFGKNCHE